MLRFHSVDGDLKGIAARYQPLELQQHFLYPGPTGPRTIAPLPSRCHPARPLKVTSSI